MDDIPSAYMEGRVRASAIDKRLADIYVQHTRVGDPLMDAAVKDLASLQRSQSARFAAASRVLAETLGSCDCSQRSSSSSRGAALARRMDTVGGRRPPLRRGP